MSNLPNPHDAAFKALLSDIRIARDFFDIHLPANLKPHCDLNTLQLASGSFVKGDLRQQFSDILYSLKIAGQTGYLYILIEHVSKAKLLTPFQVLGYQIDAMRQHLTQGHEKLPVVIPLLFYLGLRRAKSHTENGAMSSQGILAPCSYVTGSLTLPRLRVSNKIGRMQGTKAG